MEKKDFYEGVDMGPADELTNRIVFGCLAMTVVFAFIGFGAIILIATGVIKIA